MKTLLVGALITIAAVLAQTATQFDPDTITDWRAWAVGIVAASIRQLGVYFVTRLPKTEA